MPLRELQNEFMAAMYGKASAADGYFSEELPLSPHEQLSVYQGSVQSGLVGTLGDVFPRTRVNLGAKFFDAMALKYVLAHPSTSPSLDDFGLEFPAFCQSFPPLQDYPYVGDLARIEWAWHCAFHAAPVNTLKREYLLGLEMPALLEQRLTVLPHLQLISSPYPVFQIWQMSEPDHPSDSDASIDLTQGGEQVIVWRPDLQVQVSTLTSEPAQLLEILRQAVPIGEAVEQLAGVGIAYERAIESLTHLMSLKVFASPDALRPQN